MGEDFHRVVRTVTEAWRMGRSQTCHSEGSAGEFKEHKGGGWARSAEDKREMGSDQRGDLDRLSRSPWAVLRSYALRRTMGRGTQTLQYSGGTCVFLISL